jgi:HK97 family phage major capsid protein
MSHLSPAWKHAMEQVGITGQELAKIVNQKRKALPDNVPIPANSTELAEFMGDPGRYSPILASREALHEFVEAYGHQQQGDGTELRRIVAEETQRNLTQWLKDKGVSPEAQRLNLDPQAIPTKPVNMLTGHLQAAAYNPAAPGVMVDGQFKTAVDFFKAAWHLQPDIDLKNKMDQIRNAASSVVPADGGFLVPETLRSQLLQMALEMAIVRRRATVVPMETARVPFPAIDVTSHASSVFGGMIGYWGEEGSALTDANPKFRRVVLDAKKLTGFSIVPNELLTDSIISFAALIEALWPKALAWFEDVAFYGGSGVGQPLGFLGSGNPAAVEVAAEAGQSPDTILIENIVKMYARQLPASLGTAEWFVSNECLPQLFLMALNVGTGGGPVMLTNAAGPAPMSILGRPIVPSEKSQRLGNRGDIAFDDLSYYLIGDRQAMSAATSTDYRFGTDETAYRLIQRVDGTPWVKNAVTPQNGGDSLSPFVELAAR